MIQRRSHVAPLQRERKAIKMKTMMNARVRAGQAHPLAFWLTGLVGLGLACCASLTATAQPTISAEPRTQFAWEGKRFALSVTAKGTVPLAYQWQFNGTDITDATNRSLSIAQVQLTNDGSYRLVVTDPTGATTSQVARVRVRRWLQPTSPHIPARPARHRTCRACCWATASPVAHSRS